VTSTYSLTIHWTQRHCATNNHPLYNAAPLRAAQALS
jgi:hypothetical protein